MNIKIVFLLLLIIMVVGCSGSAVKINDLLNQNNIPSEYSARYYTESNYRGTTSTEYLFNVNNGKVETFNSETVHTGLGLNYYCYQVNSEESDECECQFVHSRGVDSSGNSLFNKTVEECGDYKIRNEDILMMENLVSKLKTDIADWESIKKSNNCYSGSNIKGKNKYDYEVCFSDGTISRYEESYEAVERWGDGKTTWEIINSPIQIMEKEVFE